MSEVRSWSAPMQQMSRRPTVAGTDQLNSLIFIKSKTKLNTLIFIRSKTPPYLVTNDKSASSAASVPTLPSSLLSRF